MPTSVNTAVKLSQGEILASKLLDKAKESRSYREERLPISFLKLIQEVVVCKSQFNPDMCYAQIRFKDGKSSPIPLDFNASAEPGDRLSVSSLRFKFIEGTSGTFECITGRVV